MNRERQHRAMPGISTVPHQKLPQVSQRDRASGKLSRQLRVMKFGGTSVADAVCIERAVNIIRNASQESQTVVVVSAMAGVTNKLIEAGMESEAVHQELVNKIFDELRNRHAIAVDSLIHSAEVRDRIKNLTEKLLYEGQQLCQGTMMVRELTPRVRDLVSSLGERLLAPLLAAALHEAGLASEAIDATEVIVTDSYHGGAEPRMDGCRDRCQKHLAPLLQRGIIPVVTGFIGATEDGVLTTLGRGGSDYSATVLAAALNADEVVIWTDVDGLQTADPRIVDAVSTIPEVSYCEAAELAYFGAKVLHPKTLRALTECGIPVWIRNTFFPERQGTRITSAGAANGTQVRAITSIKDAAMITIGGPALVNAADVLVRTLAATSSVRADVLLISQSSAESEVCLALPLAHAKRAIEALRHEFAPEFQHKKTEHIVLESEVALITVVGQNMRREADIAARLFGALTQENVNLIALSQGLSDCKMSFLVGKEDLRTALNICHQHFVASSSSVQVIAAEPVIEGSAAWLCESLQVQAEGD